MPHLGMPELLIVLAVVLLIFGAAKLPAIGQGLGQAISGFKKAVKDEQEAPAAAVHAVKNEDGEF